VPALALGRDGWSVVGVLGGRHPGRVGSAGLVTPAGGAWSVDWRIGTGDRWYDPATEPTLRQRRIGIGPVLETTIRVGSGDARHIAYGAMVGGREVIVVEVTNDSPLPVALALAVRPGPADRGGGAHRPQPLRLDGRVISAGLDPLLILSRPPREAGASPDRDLLEAIMDGASLRPPLAWDAPVSGPATNAVAVYPLPHRSAFRFCVVPASTGMGAPATALPSAAGLDPAAAPDASAVASGWASVVGAAARFQFPDPAITDLFDQARTRLLLSAPSLDRQLAELAPGSGLVLAGLAAGGHRAEARAGIDAIASAFPARLHGSPAATADIVAALALATVASDRPLPDAALETAVQLTALVDRRGDRSATAQALRGLARLSALTGEGGATGHLASRASQLAAAPAAGSAPALAPRLDQVLALAGPASAAGTWGGQAGDDAVAAARFVLAARSLLIDDSTDDLSLLAEFPGVWRGGAVEVHRAPTVHGELSYAIRWHGYRPALLWQLDGGLAGETGRPGEAPTLRCAGLDPYWTSTERRGETLLGGTAEALPAPPAAGESFS
jgi:hypothetical protein